VSQLRKELAAKEQEAARHAAQLSQRIQEHKLQHERKVAQFEQQIQEKEIALAEVEELAAATEQQAQLRASEWQFKNHLEIWQPYDPHSNNKLMQLYAEWMRRGRPIAEYSISERYMVNFAHGTQINLRSGGERPIRLVQGGASAMANATQTHEDITELVEELSTETTQLKEHLQAKNQELAESRRAAMSLEEHVNENNQRLLSLSSQMAQEKDAFTVELRSLSQELSLAKEGQQARQDLDSLQQDLRRLRESKVEEEQESARIVAVARQEAAEIQKQGQEKHDAEMSQLQQSKDALQKELADIWDKLGKGELALKSRQIEADAKLAETKHLCQQESESTARAMEDCKRQQRDLKKQEQSLASREKTMSTLQQHLKESQAAVIQCLADQAQRASVTALLRAMPEMDDKELRRTGTTRELLCDYGKDMNVKTLVGTKRYENLSSAVLTMLTDLPQVSDYVHNEEELHCNSPDFKFLEAIFQGSLTSHRLHYDSEEWCEPPQLTIVKITTVPFPSDLLQKYTTNRERISKKPLHALQVPMDAALKPITTQRNANEYFLFHGCPWAAVDDIAATGFDWRLAGKKTGMMFGRGIYFAPRASKCDFYADTNKDGTKCMFLARVMLGSSLPRWRKCTDVTTVGPDFDSICAMPREYQGSVDFPEMVIYQKGQALPCFKIEYKHESSCRCNLCRRVES